MPLNSFVYTALAIFFPLIGLAWSQQVPDPNFKTSVENPAYIAASWTRATSDGHELLGVR